MCDVPKNVSTNDAHVVHGRTHTAEELADFRPLRLGGLRVLIPFVVPVLFGILTAVVYQHPDGDPHFARFIGAMASTMVFLPLALAVTGFSNPVDWLRQYWQRNVRGYAVAYWIDDQGKLVGMSGRRLSPDNRSKSNRSPTIYLPLGGWLHWPLFADCGSNHLHEYQGVRVRWPWFEPTPDKVWVADRDGARVKLWVHDALVLWGGRGFSAGHNWFEISSKVLRNLERLERGHSTALALLLEVYDRIVATKRFIKSMQAQAIANNLRRRLHEELPYDHPRRAEFANRPTTKAAPAATKT